MPGKAPVGQREGSLPRLPRDVRQAIRETLEDMEGAECIFFACPGPDVRPISGATCRVCWSLRRLRRLANKYGITLKIGTELADN